MGFVNPRIHLDNRKETIGLTPMIGSLSTRPLELDFSQLLKAVKTRASTSKNSVLKATQLPDINSIKLDKKHISRKYSEQNLTVTSTKHPLLAASANRTVEQSLSDVTKSVKNTAANSPIHQIALQHPTEVSATPLIMSDPLHLLVPIKREQKNEERASQVNTSKSDSKQANTLNVSERKESQTTQKLTESKSSTATPASTEVVDPANMKASATAKRKLLEHTITTDTKSQEVKNSEVRQVVTPLDTRPVTTNLSTVNLEPTKHINAPTLPALVEKLGVEIKQRLRDGERTLELFVTAPLIGKIFIELSERDGQWVAAFSADNAAMQDLLQRHRDQLAQSLTSTSGIPAEIIVANTNDNASFREQFAQSNGNTGSNGKHNLTSREESPREYLPRTAIHPRSLTATREWIA